MKIMIKNRYTGGKRFFENKKEFCDYLEREYYSFDSFIENYNRNKSISSLYFDILYKDFELKKGKEVKKYE